MKIGSPLRVVATIALLVLAFQSDGLAAQGRGRGHAKGEAKAAGKEKGDKHDDKGDKHDKVKVVAIDRDVHHRLVREYYAAGSLPPGLAKRQALPPGLRAQLRENGALPPGLQKRLVPVPAPLNARFPPVPPDYHRYFAGDDFLVIDTRTNRVVAVIRDVWR